MRSNYLPLFSTYTGQIVSNGDRETGPPYYEYISNWVDDILVASEIPDETMKYIGSVCNLIPIDVAYNLWKTTNHYLGEDCG